MKKVRFITGALLSAAFFFACTDPYGDVEGGQGGNGDPSEQPEIEAVEGKVVVVLNAVEEATVCGQDIVFAGDYNGYNTNPADMVKFEPVDGYAGWYKAEITPSATPSDPNYIIKGKPCSLAKDGTFPGGWDHQWYPLMNDAGTVEKPIEVIEGNAELKAENTYEQNLCIKDGADVVYVRTYSWKTNPCNEEDVYPIVFKVRLPNGALPDSCTTIVAAGIKGQWGDNGKMTDGMVKLSPNDDRTLWTSDTIEGIAYKAEYKYAAVGGSGTMYWELAEKAEDASCAEAVGNRKVMGRVQNDVVYEWRDITIKQCKHEEGQ